MFQRVKLRTHSRQVYPHDMLITHNLADKSLFTIVIWFLIFIVVIFHIADHNYGALLFYWGRYTGVQTVNTSVDKLFIIFSPKLSSFDLVTQNYLLSGSHHDLQRFVFLRYLLIINVKNYIHWLIYEFSQYFAIFTSDLIGLIIFSFPLLIFLWSCFVAQRYHLSIHDRTVIFLTIFLLDKVS